MKDGFPVNIRLQDGSVFEFLPVVDNGTGETVDVHMEKIVRVRFAAYKDVTTYCRLDNGGILNIGGGRPNIDGTVSGKNRYWAKFYNHPGEKVRVMVKNGLVTRVTSLDSDLDVEFALVWDKQAQRYTTSFVDMLSDEFNLLGPGHEIHHYQLSKDGSLNIGGRAGWIDFGAVYGYQRVDIFDIRNPSGRRAFVVGADVVENGTILATKRLSLIYAVAEGAAEDSFDKGLIVNVFEKFTQDKLAGEDGKELRTYILAEIGLDQEGILQAGGYWGRFSYYPGARIEAKVIGGERSCVLFIKDNNGDPVFDVENKPLVIDVRKDIKRQMYERSKANQDSRITESRESFVQGKALLAEGRYKEAIKSFARVLYLKSRRVVPVVEEIGMAQEIEIYVARARKAKALENESEREIRRLKTIEEHFAKGEQNVALSRYGLAAMYFTKVAAQLHPLSEMALAARDYLDYCNMRIALEKERKAMAATEVAPFTLKKHYLENRGLDDSTILRLLAETAQDNADARGILVESYIWLVKQIAARYANPQNGYIDDLIQEGVAELYSIVDDYAHTAVDQEPSFEEHLRKELNGLFVRMRKQGNRQMFSQRSLEEEIGEDGFSLKDTLVGSLTPGESELLEAMDLRNGTFENEQLRGAFDKLDERERRVVVAVEVAGMTYEDLADGWGMSIDDIDGLYHRALEKMSDAEVLTSSPAKTLVSDQEDAEWHYVGRNIRQEFRQDIEKRFEWYFRHERLTRYLLWSVVIAAGAALIAGHQVALALYLVIGGSFFQALMSFVWERTLDNNVDTFLDTHSQTSWLTWPEGAKKTFIHKLYASGWRTYTRRGRQKFYDDLLLTLDLAGNLKIIQPRHLLPALVHNGLERLYISSVYLVYEPQSRFDVDYHGDYLVVNVHHYEGQKAHDSLNAMRADIFYRTILKQQQEDPSAVSRQAAPAGEFLEDRYFRVKAFDLSLLNEADKGRISGRLGKLLAQRAALFLSYNHMVRVAAIQKDIERALENLKGQPTEDIILEIAAAFAMVEIMRYPTNDKSLVDLFMLIPRPEEAFTYFAVLRDEFKKFLASIEIKNDTRVHLVTQEGFDRRHPAAAGQKRYISRSGSFWIVASSEQAVNEAEIAGGLALKRYHDAQQDMPGRSHKAVALLREDPAAPAALSSLMALLGSFSPDKRAADMFQGAYGRFDNISLQGVEELFNFVPPEEAVHMLNKFIASLPQDGRQEYAGAFTAKFVPGRLLMFDVFAVDAEANKNIQYTLRGAVVLLKSGKVAILFQGAPWTRDRVRFMKQHGWLSYDPANDRYHDYAKVTLNEQCLVAQNLLAGGMPADTPVTLLAQDEDGKLFTEQGRSLADVARDGLRMDHLYPLQTHPDFVPFSMAFALGLLLSHYNRLTYLSERGIGMSALEESFLGQCRQLSSLPEILGMFPLQGVRDVRRVKVFNDPQGVSSPALALGRTHIYFSNQIVSQYREVAPWSIYRTSKSSALFRQPKGFTSQPGMPHVFTNTVSTSQPKAGWRERRLPESGLSSPTTLPVVWNPRSSARSWNSGTLWNASGFIYPEKKTFPSVSSPAQGPVRVGPDNNCPRPCPNGFYHLLSYLYEGRMCLDIGASYNIAPAVVLLSSGAAKVMAIDRVYRTGEEMVALLPDVERHNGDAFSLALPDSTARLAIYHNSLEDLLGVHPVILKRLGIPPYGSMDARMLSSVMEGYNARFHLLIQQGLRILESGGALVVGTTLGRFNSMGLPAGERQEMVREYIGWLQKGLLVFRLPVHAMEWFGNVYMVLYKKDGLILPGHHVMDLDRMGPHPADSSSISSPALGLPAWFGSAWSAAGLTEAWQALQAKKDASAVRILKKMRRSGELQAFWEVKDAAFHVAPRRYVEAGVKQETVLTMLATRYLSSIFENIRAAEVSIGIAERIACGSQEELTPGEFACRELVTNVWKHAHYGYFAFGLLPDGHGLRFLCLDRGPGITDIVQALSPGYSTSGTFGMGLTYLSGKSVSESFRNFSIQSMPQKGTLVSVEELAGRGIEALKEQAITASGSVNHKIRGPDPDGGLSSPVCVNGTIGFCGNATDAVKAAFSRAVAEGLIPLSKIDSYPQLVLSTPVSKKTSVNITLSFHVFSYEAIPADLMAGPLGELQDVSIFAIGSLLDQEVRVCFSAKAKELFDSIFGAATDDERSIAFQAIAIHELAEINGKTHTEAVELQRKVPGYERIAGRLERLQDLERRIMVLSDNAVRRPDMRGRVLAFSRKEFTVEKVQVVLALRNLEIILSNVRDMKDKARRGILSWIYPPKAESIDVILEKALQVMVHRISEAAPEEGMVALSRAVLTDEEREILRTHGIADGRLVKIAEGQQSIYDAVVKAIDAGERLYYRPDAGEAREGVLTEEERLKGRTDYKGALAIILEPFERTMARLLPDRHGLYSTVLTYTLDDSIEKNTGSGKWAESIVLEEMRRWEDQIAKTEKQLAESRRQLEAETDAEKRKRRKSGIAALQKNMATAQEIVGLLEELIWELLQAYPYRLQAVTDLVRSHIGEGRLEKLIEVVNELIDELSNEYDFKEEEPITAHILQQIMTYLLHAQHMLGKMKQGEDRHVSYRRMLLDQLIDTMARTTAPEYFERLHMLYGDYFKRELGDKYTPEAALAMCRAELEHLLVYLSDNLISEAEFRVRFNLGAAQRRPVVLFLDYVPTPVEFERMCGLFGANLKAVVNTAGTPQSHYALAAKTMNVPVFVITDESQQDLNILASGPEALVEEGAIVVNPTTETKEAYAKKSGVEKRLLEFCKTRSAASGIFVSANADTPARISEAVQTYGADSIGLVRTENIYGRILPPSLRSLTATFREIVDAAGSKEVTFRVIDFQEDKKPAAWAFIDYRGYKWYLGHPIGRAVARQQLRACLRLWTQERKRTLRVMFPMIKTLHDLEEALGLLEESKARERVGPEVGLFDVGAMVETTEAVENIDAILQKVQFISFGTNDLTSRLYPQASRSDTQAYEEYYLRVQPRLARIIAAIAAKAVSQGKHVSICGDLASLMLFWPVRAAMEARGIRVTLSMPSPGILVFKTWCLLSGNIIPPADGQAERLVADVLFGEEAEAEARKDQLNVALKNISEDVMQAIRSAAAASQQTGVATDEDGVTFSSAAVSLTLKEQEELRPEIDRLFEAMTRRVDGLRARQGARFNEERAPFTAPEMDELGRLPGFSIKIRAHEFPWKDCLIYLCFLRPDLTDLFVRPMERILEYGFTEVGMDKRGHGDIMIYEAAGRVQHFGIVAEDGRVESKFNIYHVFIHPPLAVPTSYGTPHFYRQHEDISSPASEKSPHKASPRGRQGFNVSRPQGKSSGRTGLSDERYDIFVAAKKALSSEQCSSPVQRRCATTQGASLCFTERFRSFIEKRNFSRGSLILRISQGCLHQCAHCIMDALPCTGHMPAEQIREIAKLLKGHARQVRLDFDNDPFSHPHLAEILDILEESSIENDILTTRGWPIGNDHLKAQAEEIVRRELRVILSYHLLSKDVVAAVDHDDLAERKNELFNRYFNMYREYMEVFRPVMKVNRLKVELWASAKPTRALSETARLQDEVWAALKSYFIDEKHVDIDSLTAGGGGILPYGRAFDLFITDENFVVPTQSEVIVLGPQNAFYHAVDRKRMEKTIRDAVSKPATDDFYQGVDWEKVSARVYPQEVAGDRNPYRLIELGKIFEQENENGDGSVSFSSPAGRDYLKETCLLHGEVGTRRLAPALRQVVNADGEAADLLAGRDELLRRFYRESGRITDARLIGLQKEMLNDIISHVSFSQQSLLDKADLRHGVDVEEGLLVICPRASLRLRSAALWHDVERYFRHLRVPALADPTLDEEVRKKAIHAYNSARIAAEMLSAAAIMFWILKAIILRCSAPKTSASSTPLITTPSGRGRNMSQSISSVTAPPRRVPRPARLNSKRSRQGKWRSLRPR
jgi:RNA polymerase sigma factor (sigma-70 family)